LDAEGECVEFLFLGIVELVVHKQSHDRPVSISGVGSAEIGQTLFREHIDSSVCKAVENI